MPQRSKFRRHLARLRQDNRGNTLVSFAIAVPIVAGVVGVGLDYAGAASTRSKMQAVADGAALYAAREFQMVQANVEKVTAVARNYAQQLDGVSVDVAVDTKALTVRVTLEKDVQNRFGGLGLGGKHPRKDQWYGENDQRSAAVPSCARTEGRRCNQTREKRATDGAGLRGQLELDELKGFGVIGRRGFAGWFDLHGGRQGEDQGHELHARTQDRLSGNA